MKKRLWLAASLLVAIALLVGGCAQPAPSPQPAPVSEILPAEHPTDFPKNLRWLTDAEKDRVIEIALNTPQASGWVERENKYEVRLQWIGITWANSEVSEVRTYSYEEMEKAKELFQRSESVFPGVSILFGEPPRAIVQVAVDLDMGRAVEAWILPGIKKGPALPKDAN